VDDRPVLADGPDVVRAEAVDPPKGRCVGLHARPGGAVVVEDQLFTRVTEVTADREEIVGRLAPERQDGAGKMVEDDVERGRVVGRAASAGEDERDREASVHSISIVAHRHGRSTAITSAP